MEVNNANIKVKPKRITTTMRLPEDLHFELLQMCNKENRSLSNLIETMLLMQIKESAA